VPGLVETLRCPKCLNPLFDGGAKKCSACGARLKSRDRNSSPDDEMVARPRVLVERELQARIEAQTASGFRQRRRAAKTARRIAALPPSLFDAAGAALLDPGNGSWGSGSEPNPVVIDLPVSAIHDLAPPRRVESEVVHLDEPEPLALVAPIIELAPQPVPEAAPEPETEVDEAPVDEVEPQPGPAHDAETEVEKVDDAAPARAHRRRSARAEHRWRLRRTTPPVADDDPSVEPPAPAPLEAEIASAVAVTEVAEATEAVAAVEVAETAAAPAVEETEPVAPSESIVPEPEIEPAPEPEPVVAEEPEPKVSRAPQRPAPSKWQPASVAPRGAEAWEPSTSLWARRVFDSGTRREQTVMWPRPYEPPAAEDLAREYIDAEVAEPSRSD
jgi:hypothetical protein